MNEVSLEEIEQLTYQDIGPNEDHQKHCLITLKHKKGEIYTALQEVLAENVLLRQRVCELEGRIQDYQHGGVDIDTTRCGYNTVFHTNSTGTLIKPDTTSVTCSVDLNVVKDDPELVNTGSGELDGGISDSSTEHGDNDADDINVNSMTRTVDEITVSTDDDRCLDADNHRIVESDIPEFSGEQQQDSEEAKNSVPCGNDAALSLKVEENNDDTDGGDTTVQYSENPEAVRKRLQRLKHKHTCNTCGMQFSNKRALNKHNKTSHFVAKKYLCVTCGKRYSRRYGLKIHMMNEHLGERAPAATHCCSICGKIVVNLHQHMFLHSGEMPFQCTVCERRFRTKGTLTTHMLTHTEVEKPLTCPECHTPCRSDREVKMHKRYHAKRSGEKSEVCTLCNKMFHTPSELLSHSRIHTGERPFHCDLCHMKFRFSGNLKRHLRNHARNTKNVDKLCTYSPTDD